jgi:MFS family permease
MIAPALLGRTIGMSSDRRPFYWLIALALAGGGLSSLALALLPSTAGTAAIAVLGIVALCFSGIGTTVAHTALGRKRFALAKPPFEAEFLGLTNAAIGIGVAAGSIAGGLLPGLWQPLAGSQHSFRWAFATQTVAAALAASAAMIAYRRQGKTMRESHRAAEAAGTLARRRSGE